MKTVFVMRLNIDPAREPGVRKPSEVMLYSIFVLHVWLRAEIDEEKSPAIERYTG